MPEVAAGAAEFLRHLRAEQPGHAASVEQRPVDDPGLFRVFDQEAEFVDGVDFALLARGLVPEPAEDEGAGAVLQGEGGQAVAASGARSDELG